MKTFTIALTYLMTFPFHAVAQDFQKGVTAFEAGDYATALQEWTPLADQGYANAQQKLGMLYMREKDYSKARKWHRAAAEQGDDFSQFSLSVLYRFGYGVPQDNAMAHMWSNIAAANGSEIGKVYRDVLALSMTPADISKAQTMANKCMSEGYKKCGY